MNGNVFIQKHTIVTNPINKETIISLNKMGILTKIVVYQIIRILETILIVDSQSLFF